MVTLRIITEHAGRYAICCENKTAEDAIKEWLEWREHKAGDEDAIIVVDGVIDSWERTPVRLHLRMDEILGIYAIDYGESEDIHY